LLKLFLWGSKGRGAFEEVGEQKPNCAGQERGQGWPWREKYRGKPGGNNGHFWGGQCCSIGGTGEGG